MTQFLQVPAKLGDAALRQAVAVLVQSLGWEGDRVNVATSYQTTAADATGGATELTYAIALSATPDDVLAWANANADTRRLVDGALARDRALATDRRALAGAVASTAIDSIFEDGTYINNAASAGLAISLGYDDADALANAAWSGGAISVQPPSASGVATPSTPTPTPSRTPVAGAAPVFTLSVLLSASAAVSTLPADVAAALCAAIAAQLGVIQSAVAVAYVEPVYAAARRLAGGALAGSRVVFTVDAAAAAASQLIAGSAGISAGGAPSSAAVGAAISALITDAARSGALFVALPLSVATVFGFSSLAALSAAASVDAPVALVAPRAAPGPAEGGAVPLGAVVGGAVGGVAVLAVLACVCSCAKRRKGLGGDDGATDAVHAIQPPPALELRGSEEPPPPAAVAAAPAAPRAKAPPQPDLPGAYATIVLHEDPAPPPFAPPMPLPPPPPAAPPLPTIDDLCNAAARGDERAIAAALAAAPSLVRAARAADGFTAAHCAARGGCATALAALLRAGADVHAVDARGCTVLHRAALGKSVAAVEVALAAGAHIDARTLTGKTAREVAVLADAADVVAALDAAGDELVGI